MMEFIFGFFVISGLACLAGYIADTTNTSKNAKTRRTWFAAGFIISLTVLISVGLQI